MDVDALEFVAIRGTGTPFQSDLVYELVARLDTLRADFPEKLRAKDPKGGEFEARACAIVHQTLRLPPAVIGDPGFWTWLAVEHFTPLVEWRFNSPAALTNYGLGASVENLLYRLWMRGELGCCEPEEDPYSLARRGDQDFWRSHLLRQSYARCRTVARALIRFQFPDANPDTPRLPILGIRELAKRLRLLRTNLVMEVLDTEDAALCLVGREASALSPAD